MPEYFSDQCKLLAGKYRTLGTIFIDNLRVHSLEEFVKVGLSNIFHDASLTLNSLLTALEACEDNLKLFTFAGYYPRKVSKACFRYYADLWSDKLRFTGGIHLSTGLLDVRVPVRYESLEDYFLVLDELILWYVALYTVCRPEEAFIYRWNPDRVLDSFIAVLRSSDEGIRRRYVDYVMQIQTGWEGDVSLLVNKRDRGSLLVMLNLLSDSDCPSPDTLTPAAAAAKFLVLRKKSMAEWDETDLWAELTDLYNICKISKDVKTIKAILDFKAQAMGILKRDPINLNVAVLTNQAVDKLAAWGMVEVEDLREIK